MKEKHLKHNVTFSQSCHFLPQEYQHQLICIELVAPTHTMPNNEHSNDKICDKLPP